MQAVIPGWCDVRRVWAGALSFVYFQGADNAFGPKRKGRCAGDESAA